MAVKYYFGGILRGTAAERAALNITNLPLGTLFIESDTTNLYDLAAGPVWRLKGGGVGLTESSAEGTYTVYTAGTTAKVRNNRTGTVESTVDNTSADNVVPSINTAINNIKNISGIDAVLGASIRILAGRYYGKTELLLDSDAGQAGRHGIGIIGEGMGTLLYWNPTSTLNNCIRTKMNHPLFSNLMLWGNTNALKLIRAEGPTNPSTAQYNWGVVDNVIFNGAASEIPLGGAKTISNDTLPTTNQMGLDIFTDGKEAAVGTHTSHFVANWTVHNCKFFALDYGARFIGQYADMCNHSDIHIASCNNGYLIEGVQHNLNNFRIESNGQDTVGDYGIRMRFPPVTANPPAAGGNITFMNNINGELRKTGAICIKIDPGVNNVHYRNVFNSAANHIDNFRVVDDNIDINLDFDRANELRPYSSVKRVGYITGLVGSISLDAGTTNYSNGHGTMAYPNVRENGGPFASTNAGGINGGIAKNLATGSTQWTAKSIQFIPAYHTRPSNMLLRTKFALSNASSVRFFIGFINIGNVTPPATFLAPTTGSDVPDLLDSRNGIGLWGASDQDSGQLKVMHNDGTAGASVKDTVPTDPTMNTTIHAVDVVTNDSLSKYLVRYYTPGQDSVSTVVSTRIPATGARYGWICYVQNVAAADRSLWVSYADMEVIR